MRRTFATALTATLLLGACAGTPGTDPVRAGLDAGPAEGSFMSDFAEGDRRGYWQRGDYAVTSDVQRSRYLPENISFDDTGLMISISPPLEAGGYYRSGAYRSVRAYGDGRFETALRPASGSGLVTSFFLYSSSAAAEDDGEITIQFAGRDTTQVQFTYIREGGARYTHVHELDFDAADEVHLYAFERAGETVRWFVDGELAHETDEAAPLPPTAEATLLVNLWAAESAAAEMAGGIEFAEPRQARVDCISFTEPGDDHPSCGMPATSE